MTHYRATDLVGKLLEIDGRRYKIVMAQGPWFDTLRDDRYWWVKLQGTNAWARLYEKPASSGMDPVAAAAMWN